MYYKKIRSGISAVCLLGLSLAACNNQNGDTVATDTSTMVVTDTMQAVVPTDTMMTGYTMDTAGESNSGAVTTPPKPAKKWKASVEVVPIVKNPKFTKDAAGIYANSEVMPSFPGGQTAIENYINNNIEYPQDAIDNSKEGRVSIKFTVDENGKVTDVMKTGTALGSGLDKEATRVVSSMPRWNPGTVKGKPVKVSMTLPIVFKIEE